MSDGNGIVISQVNKRLSTLSIESVQAEHVGEYTCVAKNRAGEGRHSSILHVNGTNMGLIFFFSLILSKNRNTPF